MRRNKCFSGVVLGFILAASVPSTVHAQSQIVPAGNGRIYVSITDSSLSDALEKVFQAAGNPAHVIAPEARQAHVAATTYNNAQWDNIVRQLSSQNNFQFSRDAAGAYTVTPRTTNADGGLDNPFASAPRSATVRTQMNNQTVPDLNSGGASGTDSDSSGSDGKEYRLITVRHVYEGGIALLFGKSTTITTEQFISPSNKGGSKGGGGGGGGSSSFGGGSSSFGGGSSSGGGVSSFGGGGMSSFGGSSGGSSSSGGVSSFGGFGH